MPLLRERLEKLADRPSRWELLFVSDGSTDGSAQFIEAWAKADSCVKLIILTRNFGHQYAISAGLSLASGDYVGIMDADLQDEPEVLLEMYRLLRAEPVDVVYAVRTRRNEGRVKRFFYYLFYRLFNALSKVSLTPNSITARLMSRRFT